ncbi:MAG: hypothetical protein Q8M22_15570 [Actinomycetota bacterium]|nr:hypothetical protein [Actinomycetota bacterium]
MNASAADDEFWEAAASLLERPGVTRSTMMGYPCLRLLGDFFASWDPHQHALVVKLDRQTVTVLVAEGLGEPFAPGGRPFREWLSIPPSERESWPDRLDAAFDCAVERAAAPRVKRAR